MSYQAGAVKHCSWLLIENASKVVALARAQDHEPQE